jgi:uncharacterized protein (DUF849 family)
VTLIKACLNGSRAPGTHPALPLRADEVADEAAKAVRAGANALHIHPRDRDGGQTLEPEACGAALKAVRARCPGVPVGLTTALWIDKEPEKRLEQIRAWGELPDFVSVNFDEPGTEQLCQLLLERGIGMEAGLGNADCVQLLLEIGMAERCVRLLLEPDNDETVEAAMSDVEEMERLLDEGGVRTPRLQHGYNATAWPLLESALRKGYDVRIGLEDTLSMPDGRQARDNAELVAYAYQLAARAGRL